MAEKPVKKIKRHVKNPETFRERAVKAAAGEPQAAGILKRTSVRVLAAPFRLIVRATRKLSVLKVFKPLRRPLRLASKVIFPAYFRRSWQELRLVTWPTWRESRRLTFAVLIFAVVFGAAVAGVDWGLDKIFRNLLLK